MQCQLVSVSEHANMLALAFNPTVARYDNCIYSYYTFRILYNMYFSYLATRPN